MEQTPEWALGRIREAREKQLKELDLSCERNAPDERRLERIPAQVFELEHLEVLKLKHNRLTALPPEIVQLSNLREFDLNGNRLTALPPQIGQLTNLTALDLRWNRLTALPPEIGQLTNLPTLDLQSNRLTALPPQIGQLTNLTTLDLRDNQLTALPPEILQLTNLRELYLTHNQLTALPPEIGLLTNLIVLDLSNDLHTERYHSGGNQFTALPPEILQLTNLRELYLARNQVTALPPEIGLLTNLTTLVLSANRLTALPPEIGQLTNLIVLDLNDNELTTLPRQIGQLTNLTTLDLRENQLTALPPEIGQLANLTELDLFWNRLSALPAEIGRLTKLLKLDLGDNDLTALPPEIARLTSLTRLNLGNLPDWHRGMLNKDTGKPGNQLRALPPEIVQLTNLRELYLNNSQLMAPPPEIGQLTNVTILDLSRNRLTALPPEIGQLTNLTTLQLSVNRLTALPPEIGQLPNLRELDLVDNQLTALPPEIVQLSKLETLVLGGNPIETPPPEIAARGIAAIREYFQQLEAEGVDHLYEAKLLIVGEPEAGKTSLAKKIEDPNYALQPDEGTTKGIDVIEWDFPMADGRPFKVNIWDFGGQEIYKATHQFFLTKRSLYALVADTRKEDTDFFYWLNAVELLSDNSPLLIVKNEKQDRHREINERQLRGRFTNLKDTLATNLADNRGLDEVVEAVKYHISHLPHVGSELPKTWVRVRQALEQDPRNYISLEEYLGICEENRFTRRRRQLQLSGYLHDLGVCLHFQDDPLLRRTVILKPEWGTDAVYKVLDNPALIRNLGQFTRDDLGAIWHEDKYAGMQDELLQLMMRFQLCYEIPGSPGNYIAPQLLTLNQPEYEWDERENLFLRYTYTEFMPKGIVTRFIVAMDQWIADQECVWRNGVVLDKDETRAEVVEWYDGRELRIRMAGKHKRDFLTIVTYQLDEIHKLFHRLRYDKLIPCNCATCQGSAEPHFFRYEHLRRFRDAGQDRIQCLVSFELVNVRQLIDDVVGIPQRQIDPARLRQLLVTHLNESELRDLCFDLEVNYDNLAAKGMAGKARELIAHLERRGRLSDLLEVGRRLRPELDWDRVFRDEF